MTELDVFDRKKRSIFSVLIFALISFSLSACLGSSSGPTVQQIQSTECVNQSFVQEWECIKLRMANNPRHQSSSLRNEVAEYTLYGNKLAQAVNSGLMGDAQASMKLIEFANAIDSQLIAKRQLFMQSLSTSNNTSDVQTELDSLKRARTFECIGNGGVMVGDKCIK